MKHASLNDPSPFDHRRTVLIVDDDPIIRDALRGALADLGCEVRSAESVDQACRVAETEDLDVIVSDIHLPGNGLSLPSRLQHIRLSVPVVLMTGIDGSTGRRRALAAGAFDCLLKPVSLHVLKATLSRAFQQRSAP